MVFPTYNQGPHSSQGGFFAGKIDVSSQAADIAILQALPEYSGNETIVSINTNSLHMRCRQQIHGMDVEGASLYMHVNKLGMVVGVNSDASTAIDAALKELRVPAEVHGNCSSPTLTVVCGLKDGEAHLAWMCTI